MSLPKLPVFLTVDAEIWPYKPGWPESRLQPHEKDLSRQFAHCILGMTDQGELGLRYQMARLNQHGLRATFFVEALHAAAVGDKWLAETVGMIQGALHDVQMHVHSEWLSDAGDPALPPQYRQFMWQFSLADQTRILDWAKRRLERQGVKQITAFRAGSFGANSDTLQALADIGVTVDSSYHRGYLGGACRIETPAPLHQRYTLGNVIELPMTVFADYPGHLRPAQLAACSSAELEHALIQAWSRRGSSFVILWHGQELLQPHITTSNGPGQVSRVVVRRFERLCKFLTDNADKFQTMAFSDVTREGLGHRMESVPLKSKPMLTAHRLVEQVIARYL